MSEEVILTLIGFVTTALTVGGMVWLLFFFIEALGEYFNG